MAKTNKPAAIAPDPSIEIAALRLDYPGRFDSDEIRDSSLRLPLNATCRALEGIHAIVKILYANDIEQQGNGVDAVKLSPKITNGLFEALVLLAEQGNANATNLGEELFQRERGGRQ